MTEDTAHMVETVDGHDGDTLTATLDELLEKYRIYRGRVTRLLKGWDAATNRASPSDSSAWQIESLRARVVIAMRSVYESHADHVAHLELTQEPIMVEVTKGLQSWRG